jgi:hypothetical protein
MKFYSASARTILESGGKLRKVFWNPDTHIILHGVWIYRSDGIFGPMSKERLTLKGQNYHLYHLSFDSIFENEWAIIAPLEKFSNFGLPW